MGETTWFETHSSSSQRSLPWSVIRRAGIPKTCGLSFQEQAPGMGMAPGAVSRLISAFFGMSHQTSPTSISTWPMGTGGLMVQMVRESTRRVALKTQCLPILGDLEVTLVGSHWIRVTILFPRFVSTVILRLEKTTRLTCESLCLLNRCVFLSGIAADTISLLSFHSIDCISLSPACLHVFGMLLPRSVQVSSRHFVSLEAAGFSNMLRESEIL